MPMLTVSSSTTVLEASFSLAVARQLFSGALHLRRTSPLDATSTASIARPVTVRT